MSDQEQEKPGRSSRGKSDVVSTATAGGQSAEDYLTDSQKEAAEEARQQAEKYKDAMPGEQGPQDDKADTEGPQGTRARPDYDGPDK